MFQYSSYSNIISEENSSIFDELHIDIPRCTQLYDSFNHINDRSSDALSFSTGKFTLAQNTDDERKSSIDENEHDTIRHIVSNQSNTSLSSRRPLSSSVTSSLKAKRSSNTPSVEFDVLENRQHLLDDTNISTGISIESAENKDLDISPIMTLSQQTSVNHIENEELISRQKPTKYYVKNLYFDIQSDRLSINTSSRLLRKPIQRKKKARQSLIPIHSSHRTTFLHPSTNLSLPRAIHHHWKNPCQIFEVDTYCQPYACICTSLH